MEDKLFGPNDHVNRRACLFKLFDQTTLSRVNRKALFDYLEIIHP